MIRRNRRQRRVLLHKANVERTTQGHRTVPSTKQKAHVVADNIVEQKASVHKRGLPLKTSVMLFHDEVGKREFLFLANNFKLFTVTIVAILNQLLQYIVKDDKSNCFQVDKTPNIYQDLPRNKREHRNNVNMG